MLPKLIVIVGPTASGKTSLGIKLAKKWNGEIISADSRQVYKGLNLLSGKATRKEMSGIRHYCLDLVSPRTNFSADRYRRCFLRAVGEIEKRGKLPIVVGGTGFYIDAALGRMGTGGVPPNPTLRKKLAGKSTPELFRILQKLDPQKAKMIDSRNIPRLVRAIEISRGSTSGVDNYRSRTSIASHDIIWLGIKHGGDKLRAKIRKRLLARMKAGMIGEIKKLRRNGVSWKRLEELGLESRWLGRSLHGGLTREQALYHLENAIWRYSKRQMTWFRRNPTIHWVETSSEALNHVKKLTRAGA